MNGIAERAVRRIKETTAVLLRSGLDERWADSVECCCYLRNVEDSPGRWEKHLVKGDLENHLKAPVIPFGAMVEYQPTSAKDQSRLHQFGQEMFTWSISSDMHFIAGGIWKRGILVVDIEELDIWDA